MSTNAGPQVTCGVLAPRLEAACWFIASGASPKLWCLGDCPGGATSCPCRALCVGRDPQ